MRRAVGPIRLGGGIAKMEIRRLWVAHGPHAGLAGRSRGYRAPWWLGLDHRFHRCRPAGEAETVRLADHGVAGDTFAELLGDLACRLALEPQALQQFDAFLSPSHVKSHLNRMTIY